MPKNIIPRSTALKLYAREIEQIYLDLEKDSGAIEGAEDIEAWIGGVWTVAKVNQQAVFGRPIIRLMTRSSLRERFGAKPQLLCTISSKSTSTLAYDPSWRSNPPRLRIPITDLPWFAFASSISFAGFADPGRRLSEISVTPETAATSIGYGQSKLVIEKVSFTYTSPCDSGTAARVSKECWPTSMHRPAWSTYRRRRERVVEYHRLGAIAHRVFSFPRLHPGALGTVSWLLLKVGTHSMIIRRNKELTPVIHASHPCPVPCVDIKNAFSVSLASRTRPQLPIVRFDE
ncbi:hypothetical protein OPQ81_006164 [Rhizoctonia solani]|nr:hypothetical protein OPQ81_006164 [Rhizoctonia solani]